MGFSVNHCVHHSLFAPPQVKQPVCRLSALDSQTISWSHYNNNNRTSTITRFSMAESGDSGEEVLLFNRNKSLRTTNRKKHKLHEREKRRWQCWRNVSTRGVEFMLTALIWPWEEQMWCLCIITLNKNPPVWSICDHERVRGPKGARAADFLLVKWTSDHDSMGEIHPSTSGSWRAGEHLESVSQKDHSHLRPI